MILTRIIKYYHYVINYNKIYSINMMLKFLGFIFPKGQWSITRIVIILGLFAILDLIVIYYKYYN